MRLDNHPVHLGLGATAKIEPEFSGDMAWYAAYSERHAADGAEGRLVSSHTFSKSWEVWEVHPNGEEVVLCQTGEVTLIQEIDGEEKRTKLTPGEYAINPPGVWHSADATAPTTVLFITAGMGTQHRPR